jgi:cyanate permease
MEPVPVEIVHSHEAVVREMITREDELTNQRMLWMAAFNGLLFAALGFAWEKSDARFFEIVLSALGIASSFLNGLTLISAMTAQRRLLLWWRKEVSNTTAVR